VRRSRRIEDRTPEAIRQEVATTGLESSWSRCVEVAGRNGAVHRWHLLDRPGTNGDTVLCLHGNPTWSYLWSRLLRELDASCRVLAPDHLSMGFSEDVGPRRYRDRIEDVADLLDALDVRGPVWVVGHDWGGAIAMGLAVHHPERVQGLLLANTGIGVPRGRRAPALIRLAASRGLHRVVTETTSVFVRGTPLLPGRRLTGEQRRSLLLPYRNATARRGVAGFVADVPFDERHPSSKALGEVAERLGDVNVPVRLVWGARDPVFDDSFAEDFRTRFVDARLHRIPDAGHLSVFETSIAPILEAAMTDTSSTAGHAPRPAPAEPDPAPIWARVLERVDADGLAVSDARTGEKIDMAGFARKVGGYAVSLRRLGVTKGERVAVLVPPSIPMLAALYALWRIGAVPVVADKGLGLRGLGRALRSARPGVVLGPRKALLASRALRWAPWARRLRIEELEGPGVHPGHLRVEPPLPDDPAVVVFTSGATGPAKGVRYTHRQLCAQRDALRDLYKITDEDSLVAAFAPFAVFGPALGISTGLVDVDASTPALLTAAKLEDACSMAGATLVFASPAALANVVRTSDTARAVPAFGALRLVLSAGAPVPLKVLEGVAGLCPSASIHTPYGMTEILPVADVSLEERRVAGEGVGVCVGRPVPGCRVAVVPLDGGTGHVPVGVCGEVVVHSPWMSSGYDRLWHTEHAARPVVDGDVWHRTGDLGHLDAAGRLWIEGRLVHLIETLTGPLSPVPLEVLAETVPGVGRAAAVGVGPRGLAQVVLVVELTGTGACGGGVPAGMRPGLASEDLTRLLRSALAPTPLAAVWVTDALPVDIRHNAKIDRSALACEMGRRLEGGHR